MATIALLTISNIFMTIAWYGHLKFKQSPLWKVVLISWAIAFVEYCFQVPANRIGHYQFSAAQLKTKLYFTRPPRGGDSPAHPESAKTASRPMDAPLPRRSLPWSYFVCSRSSI